jgi:hypothetical protein
MHDSGRKAYIDLGRPGEIQPGEVGSEYARMSGFVRLENVDPPTAIFSLESEIIFVCYDLGLR